MNLDEPVLGHVGFKHAPLTCCVALGQDQDHLCAKRKSNNRDWDFVRSALQTLREASIESAMFSIIDFPTFEEEKDKYHDKREIINIDRAMTILALEKMLLRVHLKVSCMNAKLNSLNLQLRN